jgi:hypothetical protein
VLMLGGQVLILILWVLLFGVLGLMGHFLRGHFFFFFFFVVVKVFEDFRVRVLLGFLWWRNEKKQR